MVKIKICGLTRRRDVELAVQLGADYLGFVLSALSPRGITIAELSALTAGLPDSVKKVGVFVDEKTGVINAAIRSGHLDFVQLHGHESPECLEQIQSPVIRSMHLQSESDLEQFKRWRVPFFLLDGARGGGGVCCDWNLAALAARKYPVFLAGGLSAGNAAAAVAVVKPYGVDVSSSLEQAPGIKDENKLYEFFQVMKKTKR